MKFAKGLEDNLVPEWRTKYIDYKGGKKKIKAITRDLQRTGNSPHVEGIRARGTALFRTPELSNWTPRAPHSRRPSKIENLSPGKSPLFNRPSPAGSKRTPERSALSSLSPNTRAEPSRSGYGSFSNRIPEESVPPPQLDNLLLPEPMQELSSSNSISGQSLRGKPRSIQMLPSTYGNNEGRPLLKRVFSSFAKKTGGPPGGRELPLDEESKQEAEAQFMVWLAAELQKIDGFYRQKENENAIRLVQLREQLHALRDQRMAEIYAKRQAAQANDSSDGNGKKLPVWKAPVQALKDTLSPANPSSPILDELQRQMTAPSPFIFPNAGQPQVRDYAMARPKPTNEVPYGTAKRKLKVAMIEHYRGLELLKSYCMQNREGFRKITKKFDKATGLRTSKRFMTEKVNKSYFGSSEALDNMINQSEDLFARYFEKGNRKHAIERLRTKEKSKLHYGSMFRSGLLMGLTIFAAANALAIAVRELNREDDSDGEEHMEVSYLLQIWAGFFFPIFFMILFAINCRIWMKNKINYVFIFEFDTRNNLDYRQLLEIPALLMFILSLVMWLNFENFWPDTIEPIYYPVIFLCIAALIILNPFPVYYHKSRLWFINAHYRLFFSGLFPVEFRDFWLGDMFCSQTYMMGNIALFGCLYKSEWDEPSQCNSSHSRLMGLFTALPAIWRFLQCLRRYRDTKNIFPHLVNGGKYLATVMFYVTLSMWRIERHNTHLKALFIVFATINSIYTTIWDLVMDWSLLNPYAKYPFLRDHLGFKNPVWYYAAMVIDPLIRFNWIFYIIFEKYVQHSAALSFFVSFSEIWRRWIWAFFRMENEHCTNVTMFKAERQVPLPYHIEQATPHAPAYEPTISHTLAVGQTTGYQAEDVESIRPPTRRRRSTITDSPALRALGAVGAALSRAHAQDFERRRDQVDKATVVEEEPGSDDDDEDDSGENDGSDAFGADSEASGSQCGDPGSSSSAAVNAMAAAAAEGSSRSRSNTLEVPPRAR